MIGLAPGAEWKDHFADSVSVSDGVLVAGAPGDDDGGSASGAAYLYHQEETAWLLVTKLVASDATLYDQFGTAVALRAGVVVAGAPGDDPHGDNSGAACLFKRLGTGWFQVAKYVASDSGSGWFFGFSVGVSGDTAVVGTGGGAAYVFDTTLIIPTVSSWGLTLLALTLALAGALILHQRRHTSRLPCSGQAMLIVICVLAINTQAMAQVSNLSTPHHPERLLVRFKEGVSDSARQTALAALVARGINIEEPPSCVLDRS